MTDPSTISDDEFDRVLAEYIDRLNSGEMVTREDVIAAHPRIGGSVFEELEAFLNVCPPEDPPVAVLGDYRLVRRIGAGGMGVVYEAWQTSVERPVALKVLPAGIAADTRALVRFLREGRVAGKLRHASIVAVHGMGVESDTPYYAMELVDGSTLTQLFAEAAEDVERRPRVRFLQSLALRLRGDPAASEERSPKRSDARCDAALVAQLFAEVAEGLAHAHEHRVIHRDIKPSNLILDTSANSESSAHGRLRILDFGLAHVEGLESLTRSSGFVGTPLYMSPEQARRRRARVDHRTDLYSLGVTLYEALTGHVPLRGASVDETLSRIERDDPIPPRRLDPTIDHGLETVVLRCLRKSPDERYESGSELAADLRRAAAGEPVHARQPSRLRAAVRRTRRSRAFRFAALAILVVALVGAVDALVPRRFADRRLGSLPRSWSSYGTLSHVSLDGRALPCVDWENWGFGVYQPELGRGEFVIPVRRLDALGEPGPVAVSRDGEWLAFAVTDGGMRFSTLWSARRDGSEQRFLYGPGDGFLEPFDWTPSADRVLTGEYRRDGSRRLVEIPVRGGGPPVELPAPYVPGIISARYSPDGRFVAYSSPGPERCDRGLHIYDTLTGASELLVDWRSDEKLAGWVPDGSGVVFSSDRHQPGSLWLAPLLEGHLDGPVAMVRQMFVHASTLAGIDREGRLYYLYGSGGGNIVTLNVGPDVAPAPVSQPISARYQGRMWSCDWSPDGRWIASLIRRSLFFTIYDTETGKERRLEPSPPLKPDSFVWGPRWSPNGDSLLIGAATCEDGYGIFTLDVVSGELESIHIGGHRPLAPIWSPSGDSIYWRHERTIYRIDVTSGRRHEVYRAESEINPRLDISVDGASMLFTTVEGAKEWVNIGSFESDGRIVDLRTAESGNLSVERFVPGTSDELLAVSMGIPSEGHIWRVAISPEGTLERTEHVATVPGLRWVVPRRDGRVLALALEGPETADVMRLENFLPGY